MQMLKGLPEGWLVMARCMPTLNLNMPCVATQMVGWQPRPVPSFRQQHFLMNYSPNRLPRIEKLRVSYCQAVQQCLVHALKAASSRVSQLSWSLQHSIMSDLFCAEIQLNLVQANMQTACAGNADQILPQWSYF